MTPFVNTLWHSLLGVCEIVFVSKVIMNVFSQFNRFLFDIKIKIYFYISGLFMNVQCNT